MKALVHEELVRDLKYQALDVAAHDLILRVLAVEVVDHVGDLDLELAGVRLVLQVLHERDVQQPGVLVEQAEVELQREQQEVQDRVVGLDALPAGALEQPPEDSPQVRVLVNPVGDDQGVPLGARVRDARRDHAAPLGDGQVLRGTAVVAHLERAVVVVPGAVAGGEEDLLARDRQERAYVLPEDLDVVHVGVGPVGRRHVQEVHQGVVLGVRETQADRDDDAVGLVDTLLGEGGIVPPYRRPGHLVYRLLLELVLLTVAEPPHEVDRVEDSLRHRIDLLLARVHVGEPERDELREPRHREERLQEDVHVLPRAHELVRLHHLVVVVTVVLREVDVVHEMLVHVRHHRR
mmetsp:Transcript_16848/g.37157  ORF Transcript_16848/g.37157 Transcript_16848/m.37157 type:complete len:349 (-) Transcript_16848:1295-2341(-)